jgi:beta-barrel assembly-enhancing protease
MTHRKLFSILAPLTMALCSCAPAQLQPIGTGSQAFQTEDDEKKLWQRSQDFKRALEKAELVYEDRELEEYLNGVAARVVGNRLQGTAVSPQIKIVKDPFLNAFTLPDGTIYFHTGILARMENEAQLAIIMGHEVAHFINRDAARERRHKESRVATARVLQTVLILSAIGVFADKLPDVWVSASVEGYSKEMETQADNDGVRAMVESGYDPKESVRAFNLLKTDWEEAKVKEPYFYGAQAELQERIDNNLRLVNTLYERQANEAGRRVNIEEYTERIQRLLLDNAQLDMNVGRMKIAAAAIEKHLAREPDSPRAHFLMGEYHRRGGRNEEALAAYARAVAFDAQYAEAHRELGLVFRALTRHDDARVEFKKYLVLQPTAIDAPIIEGYIRESATP